VEVIVRGQRISWKRGDEAKAYMGGRETTNKVMKLTSQKFTQTFGAKKSRLQLATDLLKYLFGKRNLEAKHDKSGKVHGELPKRQEFGDYDQDELHQLLSELRLSVKEKIRQNDELGFNKSHSQRQAEEQQLIKQLENSFEQ
jgi:hypothetical protein